MASPPLVSRGGTTSAVDSNFNAGLVTHAPDKMTMLGSDFVPFTAPASKQTYVSGHTTTSTGSKSKLGNPSRYLFLADSPKFSLCFYEGAGARVSIIIDDEYVVRDASLGIPGASNYRYYEVDFSNGAGEQITWGRLTSDIDPSSNGLGFVVGQTIDFGDGLVCRVSQLNSGGDGSIARLALVSSGNLAAKPTAPIPQVSTSGSGTGCEIDNTFFFPKSDTRKMRKIEIVLTGDSGNQSTFGGCYFMGIVTQQKDTVIPWPENKAMPKIAMIGDSFLDGTYTQYAGGNYGLSIAQYLGLQERSIISAAGGTGWNTNSGTGLKWSAPERIADAIEYDADVYVYLGSQNDAGQTEADIVDAVTSTIDAIHAAKPHALCIGFGPMYGGSTTTDARIKLGWESVANQNRARFFSTQDPNQWFDPAYAPGLWSSSNDQNHPGQYGHDFLARLVAEHIFAGVMDMASI
ncbi:SGNH/GDSL hydrolase family protein [Luteolibacter pohnpeiensis]|uniref:SGNH/GDSL hydrolase family protein n=1 Tax=Luteolibacter pohnpeiensis TaxID=454153 RepID=A0A934VWU9_9BACT|nr:SGNH/GDSL hydrolase family protein [Luteolibacter pohnpeiensis]MBK1883655.1 SGNH/GDSL hydrolase family protein [Luteolibacter pohnpeiensis]